MSYRRPFILISLLTIICVATTFRCFALEWKNGSVLSSGRWAKVKVTENGVQELTYSTLRELGFKNPEKVTVFGYGGASLYHNCFNITDPDDLPQIPAIHSHDKLLFYGESHTIPKLNSQAKVDLQRNHYATAGYYFLTDSREVIEPELLPYNATASCDTLLTHQSLSYIDPQETNPVKAGVYFFSKNIVKESDAGKVDIPTPGRTPDSDAFVTGTVATYNTDPFSLKINGAEMNVPRLSGSDYFTTSLPLYNIPYTSAVGKNLKIEFTPSGQASFLAYEYLGVSYTRDNRMDNHAELHLTVTDASGNSRLLLSGSTPEQMEIWDISDPINVKRFELAESKGNTQSGTILYFTGGCSPSDPHSHRRFIAFRRDAEHHHPWAELLTANQNLHGLSTPDMLIITTDECYRQAERLAELHRECQGFDIHVVHHQDIFNEFSSGAPTPMAYRRMAKMFYDRNSSKFRYLLLFGASIYDNRLLLPEHASLTPDKVLLCYQPDNALFQMNDYTSSTTDSYFGMLHDLSTGEIINAREREGYQEMLVSVGRIPAISEYQAKVYVDKAEQYLRNGLSPQARTRALIFSDDGDADTHLGNAESVALQIHQSLPATIVSRADNGIYPWTKGIGEGARQKIVETLEQGAGFFYYSGHGNPFSFTSENLWNRLYATQSRNRQYPLSFFSSCDAFPFDRQENSLSEAMLFAEDGGTVALISTARVVFSDENRELSLLFVKNLGEAGENDTFADIFRRMWNQNFYLRTYQVARGTTIAYNFGGDPALPVYPPMRSVELSEINGKSTADAVLRPLQPNSISGTITDKNGETLTNYNGTATLFIYESKRQVPNLYSDNPPAGNRKITSVKIEDDLLCSIKLPVINGEIMGEVVLPAPSRPGEKGCIVIAADSEGSPALNASNIIKGVTIENIDPDYAGPTPEAPQIIAMYLNDDTFTDGSTVAPNPVFHAEIKESTPTSTINAVGVIRPLKLILDQTRTLNIHPDCTKTDAGGTITIDMPISELQEGPHTLTLNVTDIFGNTASETTCFQVINNEAEIRLTADRVITDNDVTFSVSHTFPAEYTAKLIIENISGKHIRTIDNITFPYTWDATADSGDPVSSGSYSVRIMATDGVRFCGSAPQLINILRGSHLQTKL